MPRIGIDGRLVGYRRGMGNFVYNTLKELAALNTDYEFIIYLDASANLESVPQAKHFHFRMLPPASFAICEQLFLPVFAVKDRIDLLHCPANTSPLFLSRRIRMVLTIHDVMYLLPRTILASSPSPYQRAGRLYRRVIVPKAANRAVAITTDSEHSKHDIVQYLGVPADRITVIYGAANHACRRLPCGDVIEGMKRRYNIRGEFVMSIGGIDPRKNTLGVLRAFALFKRITRCSHQLVVVGLPLKWRKELANVAGEFGVAEDIVLTAFVCEEDLVVLYNAADMFLYPSLYEGFGLPVLEAMACGTPVICSPRGSIPEVAGDAALLVSPIDIDALAKAMIQLVTDGTLRKTLIARGFEQASRFSWEKAAKEILKVYEECPRR